MKLETYNYIILSEEEIEILKKAKELLEEIRSNAEEKSIDSTNVIIADDALGEILYSDRCSWTKHIIWPNGW